MPCWTYTLLPTSSSCCPAISRYLFEFANTIHSSCYAKIEEACDCSREPACTVRESTSQSDPPPEVMASRVSQFNARRAFFLRKGISAEAGLSSALSRDLYEDLPETA